MGEAILAKGNRPIDSTPKSGSSNLITSGGVFDALKSTSSPPEIYIGDKTPEGDEVVWFNTATANINVSSMVATNGIALLNSPILYISQNGDDDSGDGSQTSPYATIERALNVIPKNLNGNTTIINLMDAGSYTITEINGYFGGTILFTGAADTTIETTNIELVNTSNVVIENILVKCNSVTINNSKLYLKKDLIIADSVTAISLVNEGKLITASGVIISFNGNCNIGIKAEELSGAYIYGLDGDSTTIVDGIICESGSVINVTSIDFTARTMYTTGSGGTISVNAQPTVANY